MRYILAALSGILCCKSFMDGDISLFCYWLMVVIYWTVNYMEDEK